MGFEVGLVGDEFVAAGLEGVGRGFAEGVELGVEGREGLAVAGREHAHAVGEVEAFEAEEVHQHPGAVFVAEFQKFLKPPLRDDDHPLEVVVGDARQVFGGGGHGLPLAGFDFGQDAPVEFDFLKIVFVASAFHHEAVRQPVDEAFVVDEQPFGAEVGEVVVLAGVVEALGFLEQRVRNGVENGRFPSPDFPENAEQPRLRQPGEVDFLRFLVGVDALQRESDGNH